MEHILGIVVKEDYQIAIEKYEPSSYYDYLVVARQLSINNGNGFCELQFNDLRNEKPKDLTSNRWKIESKISVPFSWSGSRAYPKITDPTGSLRQVYADPYSKTIFKGLSYADDIKAVFDMLLKYSQYKSWSEYDVECAVREKDNIILELQGQILELQSRIKQLQK